MGHTRFQFIKEPLVNFGICRKNDYLMCCIGKIMFHKIYPMFAIQSPQRCVDNNRQLSTWWFSQCPENRDRKELLLSWWKFIFLNGNFIFVEERYFKRLRVNHNIFYEVIFPNQMVEALSYWFSNCELLNYFVLSFEIAWTFSCGPYIFQKQ